MIAAARLAWALRAIATAALVGGAGAAPRAPITSRMLVETPDFSGLAIAPDESVVAFREERASIERNSHESVWYVQSLAGDTPPRRIADGGAPLRDAGLVIDEAPHWSPDSRWIYYRALIDGEAQVWRAARDASRAERVTADDADIEAFTLLPGSEQLLYRIGATRDAIRRAEQDDHDRGVRLDETIYAGQGLFRSLLDNGRLVSERTDETMTRQRLLWRTPKTYRVVDLNQFSSRAATPAEIGAFDPSGPDDEKAILRSSGGRIARLSGAPPSTRLAVRDRRLAAPEIVCDACRAMTIDAVAWAGEDALLLTLRDPARGFAQSLHVWTIAAAGLRPLATSDGLLSGDRAGQSPCAAAASVAVCVAASADMPPQIEIINVGDGARRVLHAPSARLLDGRLRAEFLAWTDDKGRPFTGYLFRPALARANAPPPLFITYYLCRGFLRGGEGDEWPLLPLAEAGIATLCINARLPPRTGRDAVTDYDAAMSGVAAIIGQLDARGVIDRRKVGMGAHSFGGEATLWIGAHSTLLAAASVSSPMATPAWYWSHALQTGFRARAKAQWGLGAPDETPDRWRALSPVFYPEKFTAPVLMQTPEQEFRSAIEYFIRMRDLDLPAELWVFPQEPHIKVQPRHKLAAYERNLDWFRFWLQEYQDPDPLKAELYRRWTEMRDRWRRRRAREASGADQGFSDQGDSH